MMNRVIITFFPLYAWTIAIDVHAVTVSGSPENIREAGAAWRTPLRSPLSIVDPRRSFLFMRSCLNDEPAPHFKVKGVAEGRAVEPVHTGLFRRKGDGLRLEGRYHEADIVVFQREAMRQVRDLVVVRHNERDPVALLNLHL